MAGQFQSALTDTDRGRQVQAVWLVGAQPPVPPGQDATVIAFVVEGTAPDPVPSERGALKIISNEATAQFHVNGTTSSTSPSGSASPTASGSAQPMGSASPSASPSAAPSASPSPTSTP